MSSFEGIIYDDDEFGKTWGDVFPWLRMLKAPNKTSWSQTFIEPETTSIGESKILSEIIGAVVEELPHWNLGQLFPAISEEFMLNIIDGQNELDGPSSLNFGDISSLTVDRFLQESKLGANSLEWLLKDLAIESIQRADTLAFTESARKSIPVWEGPHDSSGKTVLADIKQVAEWLHLIGESDRPVFGHNRSVIWPEHVIQARERIRLLTSESLLGDGFYYTPASKIVQEFMDSFSDRELEVLESRILSDTPETLASIANDYGLSRERIRQIETQTKVEFVEFIQSNKGLRSLDEQIRNVIPFVLPLETLVANFPVLSHKVGRKESFLWRVLDRLEEHYEIVDGWCCKPSHAEVIEMTKAVVEESANEFGVLSLDDCPTTMPVELTRLDPQDLERWLGYCGFHCESGNVFVRTNSIADYAVSILSVAGGPLSFEEIRERLQIERTDSSILNALRADSRTVRLASKKWALASWGFEDFSSLKRLVSELLVSSGGRIELEETIRTITSKHAVTADEVIATCCNRPFKLVGGLVRLAENPVARKSPGDSRNLYRWPDSWVYRFKITKEHLRGSGFPAPAALAGELRVHYGTSKLFESRFGQQKILWTGTQPTFGTIRRILLELNVPVGAECLAIFTDQGEFDFEVIDRGTERKKCDPEILTGFKLDRNESATDPLAWIARCVGLSENASTSEIHTRCNRRGESDLAEAILESRDELEKSSRRDSGNLRIKTQDILDLL